MALTDEEKAQLRPMIRYMCQSNDICVVLENLASLADEDVRAMMQAYSDNQVIDGQVIALQNTKTDLQQQYQTAVSVIAPSPPIIVH